jgi:hypothetical protein
MGNLLGIDIILTEFLETNQTKSDVSWMLQNNKNKKMN